MGYAKVITYGKTVEIYQYEESPRGFTAKSRKLQTARRNARLALSREIEVQPEKQVERQVKRKDNLRRVSMAFRRLVSANLGELNNPVFVTLTYAKGDVSIGTAYQDFQTFIKSGRNIFGKSIRYVCVPEFQKRGTIHFHTLVWGLPPGLAQTERSTRVVASLWGQGFVDVTETDGDLKIAGYMAKYMVKAANDSRLLDKKAYTCSRNIKRPFVEKNAVVIATVYEKELSTVVPLQEKEFDTQWLGKGRYRLFELK